MVFSLLVGNPEDAIVSWEAEKLLKNFQPLLDQFSNHTSFKLSSQVQNYASLPLIPTAAEMEDQIFSMFLREKLYNILLHAKTSEHSTRMKAMDSANKNADEILSDLNKQLNRVRQTAITQEISEIVGGAEALK